MSVDDDLFRAVRERLVTRLHRVGEPESRLVHPHAVFRSREGRLLLEVFQVGGHSASGSLPGWRLFGVSEITGADVGGERFDPAPGDNPGNRLHYPEPLCLADPSA